MAPEPSVIQRAGSYPASRYSCLHSHFPTVHDGFHRRFTPWGTLSYPTSKNTGCRVFGGVLEPRYIVGAETLDQ